MSVDSSLMKFTRRHCAIPVMPFQHAEVVRVSTITYDFNQLTEEEKRETTSMFKVIVARFGGDFDENGPLVRISDIDRQRSVYFPKEYLDLIADPIE